MRRSRWLGAWLGAGLGAIVGVVPAIAATPAKVGGVAIKGDAAVGATLTAAAVVAGDPAPTVGYEWARCDPKQPDHCSTITGATASSYTVEAPDLGQTLVARVIAKNTGGSATSASAPTPVVGAASQPGAAAPDPTVTPPASTILAVDFLAAPAETPVGVGAPTGLRYLRPFPIIRVAGSSVSGGSFIDVLRVAAPRGTRVAISCLGRGCPVGRLSRGPGRVPQLERFLPVGVAITIRAARRGYVGKYVSFVVRSHAAPKRHDACLMPGRARPVPCP